MIETLTLRINVNEKVAQIVYGYGCTATSDCQSGLNLICTTTGYLCNCPTSLSAYKCDCSSTAYFKDSTSGCGML